MITIAQARHLRTLIAVHSGRQRALGRVYPNASPAIIQHAENATDKSRQAIYEELESLTVRKAQLAQRDVIRERRRQIENEGYDAEHDDAHPNGELAAYAAFYAMPPAARDWPAVETGYGSTWGEAIIPADWGPAKPGDRRKELVKAGALILAEIERIDRAAIAENKEVES